MILLKKCKEIIDSKIVIKETKIIKSILLSDMASKNYLNISISLYNNKEYIDVRHFYEDEKENILPTKKGFSVSVEKN